jgi:hypothetical protein
MNVNTAKAIAATCTGVGILFSFLDKVFAPHVLVDSSSPDYPEWLSWFGWFVISAGAIAYIVADVMEQRRRKSSQSTPPSVTPPAENM